ncbi:glycosyltransferase [Granulosicoccus sp.]|nr:glycosyltransferase [Granulosicoccus sp.]
MQLGNLHITKRIIHIQAKSGYVRLAFDTPSPVDIVPELTFVRLSKRIARDRMLRALRSACVNTVFESDTEADNTLEHLYKAYCDKDAVYDLADAYYSIRLKSEKTINIPVSNLRTNSACGVSYSLITTDQDDDASAVQQAQAPLLILASRDVMLYSSFLQTLDELSTAAQRDKVGKYLWYTDHDHINKKGEHVEPCFKPGWNIELLRQGNYIGALIIVSRQLYLDLGGLDFSLGESALFDFLLRVAEVIDENGVQRLPGINYGMPASLYHAPHGFFLGEHDHAAMQAYLQRHASTSLTLSSGRYPGLWKAHRHLQGEQPTIDILIPTRDRADLLQQCIGSIMSLTSYDNYTITVIDNDSKEAQTRAFHAQMSSHSNYHLMEFAGDFNYSAINNYAVNKSDAEYLILLNNDTEVLQKNWLQRMVEELGQQDVACVGTRLIYPNGLLQHAGVTPGLHGVAGHRNQFARADEHGYAGSINLCADVSAVTGACLGIRRSLYQSMGGLNDKDLKVAFNDVDLCLRARDLGYRNLYLADVTLKHHESVSRGMDDDAQKRARFRSEVDYMKKMHAYWIDDDPAWHPFFSRRSVKPKIMDVELSGISNHQRYAA